MSDCEFYCLSFNNKKRKKRMEERFIKFGINCKFYEGIPISDNRIPKILNKLTKRNFSITYSHLDMIYDFYYYTDKKYAIMCEDDILIHSEFKQFLHKIIIDFNIMNLDLLLLGYELPYRLDEFNFHTNYKLKKPINESSIFTYHDYPAYLSGTSMYMITRSYAKWLLNNYYHNDYDYVNDFYNPNKILIKHGKKALIYPMISIEDSEQKDLYHQLCHNIHYNTNYI
jgi:GR25 family glycosyltransferase involved in LPS biosynthesis